MNDLDILNAGVKSIFDFGKDDLMPHFIYCGRYYFRENEQVEKLKEIILTEMRKYEIQSSILTMLWMGRRNLVTKENVKKAYEGKLKNDNNFLFPVWKYYDVSINDDLERFLINLQNQEEVKDERVSSFFTPKLTNEELELVQEGNEEHLNTYLYYIDGKNPDVDVEEMKKSDSKSKYVHVNCFRGTIPLRLETSENEDQTKREFFWTTLTWIENGFNCEIEVEVPKMSENQKQMPTDRDKDKMIQNHLIRLIHAAKCQRRADNQDGQQQCQIPDCQTMKNVLMHLPDCQMGRNCTIQHCASSRQIIAHWKHCKRPDCGVCQQLKPQPNQPTGPNQPNPNQPGPNQPHNPGPNGVPEQNQQQNQQNPNQPSGSSNQSGGSGWHEEVNNELREQHQLPHIKKRKTHE